MEFYVSPFLCDIRQPPISDTVAEWCFMALFLEGGYLSEFPETQGHFTALGSQIEETAISQDVPTVN